MAEQLKNPTEFIPQNSQKESNFEGANLLPKRPRSQKEKSKKYSVKKRPPAKDYNRPNDLYIGERSSVESQLAKCLKLLDGEEYNEIFLHGLGKAIPKTINLAVKLQDHYFGTVDYSVNTTSVKLIDDLVPLKEELPASKQHRTTSAVLIRVHKKVNIP